MIKPGVTIAQQAAVAEETEQPHSTKSLNVGKKDASSGMSLGNRDSSVSVPSRFSKKFEEFQKFLSKHKGTVGHNANDEVVINGNPIHGANFSDLIRSLYISSKKHNLIGIFSFNICIAENCGSFRLFV